MWFYHSFCKYSILHGLICRYWILIADIECLHSWNKFQMIMVYYHLYILLNLISQCFTKDFTRILAYNFLFVVFVWFWYQGNTSLIEWRSIPSSSIFCTSLRRISCYLFSKCLIEFVCKTIWSWVFVCWEFLNHTFSFSTCVCSVHSFYFFLVLSWRVVLS